ncbi:MAG: hypothetical protein WBA97_01260 [Actinophytocola sp.]|uniref:hypothetical protein n=1 Tax=Actinophytocola sp. TaxID=1872138 RepID=UPI003C780134
MRWLLTATVTLLAALTLSAPTATAERVRCAAATSDQGTLCLLPAPADWERVRNGFMSCPSCQAYGRQGVEQGRWSDYHCEGRVQGLDYYYDLYVPPGESARRG